ncbi:cache domain-containing protein [Natroniella acetigena]|uniref:cache domain-containing protein n=1 Tax=Natroniella acetigena TaxID=52004 RepID=UPI00200B8E09|nr:cache domain-containing protein [Natroniella acetigena]MCK8828157.1 cache domain-containing protein [Natroniella acetigena]
MMVLIYLKIYYGASFEPWEWVLATGIYVEDIGGRLWEIIGRVQKVKKGNGFIVVAEEIR